MRGAFSSAVPLGLRTTRYACDGARKSLSSFSGFRQRAPTAVVRGQQNDAQQQQEKPLTARNVTPLGVPPKPPEFVLPLSIELDFLLNHPVAEVIITCLVVLSAVGFALDTVDLGSQEWNQLPRFLENGIASVFTAEYILRWYSKNLSIPFLFTRAMLIDLFAVLPFIYDVVGPSIDSGVVRLLRLIRIFRLQRILSEEWRDALGDVTQAQLRIANVALTVFSILYISAGLFYDAEVVANPQIITFFDAYYFSTITLFTVGFGDVVPLTSTGRVVTVFTVLTGAVLIPFQLTEVRKAHQLSQQAGMSDSDQKRNKLPLAFDDIVPFDFNIECGRCHLRGHQKDARFCRSCAYPLRKRRFDK